MLAHLETNGALRAYVVFEARDILLVAALCPRSLQQTPPPAAAASQENEECDEGWEMEPCPPLGGRYRYFPGERGHALDRVFAGLGEEEPGWPHGENKGGQRHTKRAAHYRTRQKHIR